MGKKLYEMNEIKYFTAKDLMFKDVEWDIVLFTAYAKGNEFCINVDMSTSLIIDDYTYKNIMTIPEQYRPKRDVIALCISTNDDISIATPHIVVCRTDGSIELNTAKDIEKFIFFDIHWTF